MAATAEVQRSTGPARPPPKLSRGTRIDHPNREPAAPRGVRTSSHDRTRYGTGSYTTTPPPFSRRAELVGNRDSWLPEPYSPSH